MTRSPTRRREGSPSWPVFVDGAVLAVVLAVLALRVTITEAPAVRASSLSISRYDQVYSLVVSWVLILCAVWAWWSRRGTCRHTGAGWGLGLFLVAALAGCGVASDKRLALNQVVVSAAAMGLAVLGSRILDQAWKRHLVLALIAAMAVAGSFQCFDQVLYTNAAMVSQYQSDPNSLLSPLGIEPGTLQAFMFEHRLSTGGAPGFFTTRNSAGSFALLALFATAALFLDKRAALRGRAQRTQVAALYAVVAGFILLSLVMTRSKGVVVGLAAGGVAAVALVRWHRWITAHKMVVCLLALAALSTLVGGLIHYGLGHGRLPGGPSMLVRWQYWQACARMIGDHPGLGVGPGNFGVTYDLYKPAEALESVADPHNFVLSLLAQYGPLGLIGFLVLAWAGLGRAFSTDPLETAAIAPSGPAPRRDLGLCAVAVALAMFGIRPWVSAMLNSGDAWSSGYAALIFYGIPGVLVVAGLVLLSQGPTDQGGDRTCPGRSYVTTALGAGLLALLAANLTDFALFEPAIATCFWATVGCLIASLEGRSPCPVPASCGPAASGLRAWPLILGIAALSGACWVWLIHPVLDASRRTEQARQAMSSGDFDLAHRLMEQATAADRLSGVAPGTHGKVYLQQYLQAGPRDPSLLDKAAACFVTAAQRNPADFRDYERLGDTYDLLNRPDQAYQAYHDAALRYPGCDRLWLRLGQTAEKSGRPRVAAEHYAKAIQIEEAFRSQFAALYPDWARPVSRLGEENYRLAKRRLQALGGGQ